MDRRSCPITLARAVVFLILVVCALDAELRGFSAPAHVEMLACGVGPVEAALATARALATGRYTLAINAGIAGAFAQRLAIGSAALVSEEIYADFGLESGEPMTLPGGTRLAERAGADAATLERLSALPYPVVRGLTVTSVTTTEATARRLVATYDAEVESMEGFAFLRAAEAAGVPALEIRGISNDVGPRERSGWDFGAGSRAAVEALDAVLAALAGPEANATARCPNP